MSRTNESSGGSMYPGRYAAEHPDRACFIMADTGEVVTYAEYEVRCNQLAQLLRSHGLQRDDHLSIFMENNSRYLEACGASERSGLQYTLINSHLTAEEVAYIVDNSGSTVLITSLEKRDVAMEAVKTCPNVSLFLMVDATGDDGPFVDYVKAVASFPTTPISDERIGTPMNYSSGTTGRPKGILRRLPDAAPSEQLPLYSFVARMWRFREDMVYLSPAPLYHSAPQASTGGTIRKGGTVIIMERFDPEHYLQLVERYQVTHSQLVPTMFSRMLKLPDDVRARYDLSSLEAVVHAAAPCPVPVKQQMIEWWGPILIEYYSASEGIGYTLCDSAEWLAHPGTVGTVKMGDLHIFDDELNECPPGTPGTIYFETDTPVEYWKDAAKSREAMSPDGSMATVGDVGYTDAEGYLYLTDRKAFVIIAGGVNIYPQETENLLITHPKVADAAVFGVPNADLGEEVKAVIQPMPGVEPGPALEQELIAFCREHLSRQKCPRSVDFTDELPRLPTGKLYKRVLRDKYWLDHAASSTA